MALKKKWYTINFFNGIDEGYSDYPEHPGNYAIYLVNILDGRKKLMYVGTANNIKIRHYKHEIKRTLSGLIGVFGKINDFDGIMIKCKVIDDSMERKNIESWIIKRLKPALNN